MPQYLNINNAELCSMVGNLLENASEAIMKQQDGEKKLRVRIKYRTGPPASLFIVVDNTHDSPLCRLATLSPQTKHGGEGLGTATVRETAERHHGATSFDYDGTLFRASVMLCWMIEIPVRRRPITVRSSPRMAASHGFRRVEI